MSKVSIIVPVYNAEKTILKCLNSLINQTYENIEIIVVDDGSKDKSASLIRELSKKDKRINFHSKKNEGVSKTRNLGIELSTGDFIIFVDSDDYIENNTIEEFINVQKETDADFIFCGFVSEGNGRMVTSSGIRISVNGQKECLKHLLNESTFPLFAGPCGKLFKTKIIKEKNIHFIEDLSLGEDTCFVFEYFENVFSMSGVSDTFYHVFVGNESLSRSSRDDIWEIQDYLYQKFKLLFQNTDNLDLIENNNYMFFRGIRIALNTAVQYNWDKKKYCNLCNKIINTDEFKIMKAPASFFQKIIYYLLKFKRFTLLYLVLQGKNRIKKVMS